MSYNLVAAFEISTFAVSGLAVLLLAVFACTSRPGLACARRLGLGGRGRGARWQRVKAEGEENEMFSSGLGLLGAAAADRAVAGIVRVMVQLATGGSEEMELDTAGLLSVGDIRATVAACYAEDEAGAAELARQMVVRCVDEERGLLISLPGRTPLSQLAGVHELVVQFTLAAERERQRDGASEVSVRSIGSETFAQRKAALMGSTGNSRAGGLSRPSLSSLPRALRGAIGAARENARGPSTELARRLERMRSAADGGIRVGSLAGGRGGGGSGGGMGGGMGGQRGAPSVAGGGGGGDIEAMGILAVRRRYALSFSASDKLVGGGTRYSHPSCSHRPPSPSRRAIHTRPVTLPPTSLTPPLPVHRRTDEADAARLAAAAAAMRTPSATAWLQGAGD